MKLDRETLRQDILFSIAMAEMNRGPIVIKETTARGILKILKPEENVTPAITDGDVKE